MDDEMFIRKANSFQGFNFAVHLQIIFSITERLGLLQSAKTILLIACNLFFRHVCGFKSIIFLETIYPCVLLYYVGNSKGLICKVSTSKRQCNSVNVFTNGMWQLRLNF